MPRKLKKSNNYHTLYMRRNRIQKGQGYEAGRKLVCHWREKERMTFDRMAEVLECTRLEAITIYVQERSKIEKLTEIKRAKHYIPVPKIDQQHKYAHLIDEPINQGCSYAEYRQRSERKSRPLKQARLKMLREERRRRIALHGKIKIPKIKNFQWSGGRGTAHVE